MDLLNQIALYVGWAWFLFIPATIVVSFTVFVPMWFINKAWKNFRNIQGWRAFKKVLAFYREHHDGDLPKDMDDMQ